jgi:hypothetical protein
VRCCCVDATPQIILQFGIEGAFFHLAKASHFCSVSVLLAAASLMLHALCPSPFQASRFPLYFCMAPKKRAQSLAGLNPTMICRPALCHTTVPSSRKHSHSSSRRRGPWHLPSLARSNRRVAALHSPAHGIDRATTRCQHHQRMPANTNQCVQSHRPTPTTLTFCTPRSPSTTASPRWKREI